MLAACCSEACLLWPSPRSSTMLPERSRTSAAAAVFLATVSPVMMTVQVREPPASCTVTVCGGSAAPGVLVR